MYRQAHRGGVLYTDRLTGEGYCVQTLTREGYCAQTVSQSNMNTKPRGEVVCTERLKEQHQHQTQGRGIVYRQTHRGGVLCTDSLTGEGYCVQTDSQGMGIVYRQTHRGVVCTDRLTGEG